MAVFACLLATQLFAQSSETFSGSTVIAVPPSLRSSSPGRDSETIPSSATPSWRRWEAILNRTYPDRFNGIQKASDVVAELRQLGLPVVISQSAIDDSFTGDLRVQLKLPEQPLETRLRHLLRDERNADLVFRPENILIISLDDVEDTANFMTVAYDVSEFRLNPGRLVNMIENTVSPDSWQDTGQGLGTIQHLAVRQRDLLVVSQSYETHQQLRRLLNGLDRLAGFRYVQRDGAPGRVAGRERLENGPASSPVAVPQRIRKPRPGFSFSGGLNPRPAASFPAGGVFDVADQRATRK